MPNKNSSHHSSQHHQNVTVTGEKPSMQFGSTFGGLFASEGADPREYMGPPVARRCYTPSAASNSSKAPAGGGGSQPRAASTASSKRSSRNVSPARAGSSSTTYGMQEVEGGTLSLETFDVNEMPAADDAVVLNSPRSVRACRNLGLRPQDFYIRTYDDVLADMKTNGESIADTTVTEMRYKYVVAKAKQKLKAALDERLRLMISDAAEGRCSTSGGGASSGGEQQADSTKIQEEERRLQKIVENNKNRLRQQLLHAQLVERQRNREDERLEAQREADEQQRRTRLREMIERSKKEEEAQALRTEARELERREQQAKVELKRAMYERKDHEVKERIRLQRAEAEAENEAKRLMNVERRRQMKEQSESLMLERRAEFQRRNEEFEKAQEQFRQEQEKRKEERASLARVKQRKIREAIQRSNDQQNARIHRAMVKEQLVEEAKRQQQLAAAEAARIKALEDKEREEQRQAVIREANLKQQQKVEGLLDKIAMSDAHMRDLEEQRAAEGRVKAELQRQKELDKLDCVQRSKNIEEERIAQLKDLTQLKIDRVSAMQGQQAMLKERRKLHRQEAERTRVVMEEVTPGPTDFVYHNQETGTEGPRWKMGLPATALAQRVVLRNAPAPGYLGSPGPCVYYHERVIDSRHPTPKAFSMIRHDRWAAQSEADRTPGPSDYAPQTESFSKSRPSSSML